MNKTILVIGASSSIGIPLVEELLSEGYAVIAQFRTGAKRLERCKDVYKNTLTLIQLDFEAENLDLLVEKLLALCDEKLFAVIHLPSVPPSIQPLSKTSVDDFELHFRLQIKSLHLIFKGLHKLLINSNDFRVIGVNTEIITKKPPPKGLATYILAKAAASCYLDCLDSEYREKSIKINQILPGMFRSPLLNKIPEYVVEAMTGELDSSDDNALCPERDLVPLIVYLLSPSASHIRGQKILVGN